MISSFLEGFWNSAALIWIGLSSNELEWDGIDSPHSSYSMSVAISMAMAIKVKQEAGLGRGWEFRKQILKGEEERGEVGSWGLGRKGD